jgi:hypothetical protein
MELWPHLRVPALVLLMARAQTPCFLPPRALQLTPTVTFMSQTRQTTASANCCRRFRLEPLFLHQRLGPLFLHQRLGPLFLYPLSLEATHLSPPLRAAWQQLLPLLSPSASFGGGEVPPQR